MASLFAQEPAGLDWMTLVAVPMLAVLGEHVVAMNAPAVALFGCGRHPLPMELSALFGAAAGAVAALLGPAAPPAPAAIEVASTVDGKPCRLAIGARRAVQGGAAPLWLLTVTPLAPDPQGERGVEVVAGPPAASAAAPTDDLGRLMPAILDQLPVALLIENAEDVAVFVNRGFVNIFRYALEEIASLEDWWFRLYPDPVAREAARQRWSGLMAAAPPGDGTISTSEFQIRCGDGTDKMLQSHSFRIGGYRVHSYVDVSRRHQMLVDLKVLADTDPLTGVPNRRAFLRHAAVLMQTAPPFSLLLLDVDHFKAVNDELGHVVGDQVLVEIAARCRAVLGPGDVLARLGGEEFAVLLPRQDAARARVVAERLRHAMAGTPMGETGPDRPVTVSIGGACVSTAGASIDDVLPLADHALYAAKRAGRNRVRFHPEA
ncbi:GGDEF domain-containing protein [Ancylobacter lacus]|uniref:GGDEF domain-containing protein n=1 Tax=Ancylobacter lacus TaxID=2579970 RepID=UPI001BCBD72D